MKSSRIQEMSEKSELSSMWGLFSALESCQGQKSHKVISNGRPVDSEHLIVDYPRKLDHLASFDEECQKIQNIADHLASVTAEASVTMRNLFQEHISIEKHKTDKLFDNLASWILQQPSNSAEKSLNKITIGEILKVVICTQNHKQKTINPAKTFFDQIFLDRKLISEQKPFSDALENLFTKKDFFVDLLPEPNSAKLVEFLRPSQKEKESAKSEEIKYNSELFEMIDYKGRFSSRMGFTDRPNKIVILQSDPKTSGRVSNAKPLAFFSFREIKRKLKHTFEGTRKEPNDRFTMDENSHKRGSFFRDECICSGVDTENAFVSSTNAKKNEKPFKKMNQEPRNEGDNSCSMRNKLDFSSVQLSKKREFDVILEAKKHLSFRVKIVNAIETTTGKRSTKTLARILTSNDNMNSNELLGEIDRTDVTGTIRTDRFELNGEDESGPLSYNETCSSTESDFPSLYQLDVTKCQEDHGSPVSVLKPFFMEDANGSSSSEYRTDERQLQPLHLDFDECSLDSKPAKEEQYYISKYVHLVLEASCLDWKQLIEIRTQPEEDLLNPSLFHEVEFVQSDIHFDPMILFDHMNEILQGIYQRHLVRPRITCVPLQEFVLDEVMKESEFYLLPRTEKRTLKHIVMKDVEGSRSWFDLRIHMEQIAVHVSEDVLDESIMNLAFEQCVEE